MSVFLGVLLAFWITCVLWLVTEAVRFLRYSKKG
jgi:hypothetical protein